MKCSFCGNEIERGTGSMFVWNSGKIDYFCSRRCEVSLVKLKRDPKKMKWIRKRK